MVASFALQSYRQPRVSLSIKQLLQKQRLLLSTSNRQLFAQILNLILRLQTHLSYNTSNIVKSTDCTELDASAQASFEKIKHLSKDSTGSSLSSLRLFSGRRVHRRIRSTTCSEPNLAVSSF